MRAPFVIGKSHNQNAVGRGHADGHYCTNERRDVKRGAGNEEHPDDAAQSTRQGHDDYERVSPRLEIHHHQEVNEHNREDETGAQSGERAVHALDLAADAEKCPTRQFRLKTVHYLGHFVGHSAEIAALHIGKYIKDWLHIVVVYDDR